MAAGQLRANPAPHPVHRRTRPRSRARWSLWPPPRCAARSSTRSPARPYAEKLRWVLADLAETLPQIDPETRASAAAEARGDEGRRGHPGDAEPRPLRRPAGQPEPARGAVHPGRRRYAACASSPWAARAATSCGARARRSSPSSSTSAITPATRRSGRSSQVAIEDFIEGEADEVYILYAEFVNTVTQRPELFKLLPDRAAGRRRDRRAWTTSTNRPARRCWQSCCPRYIERQVYGAVLEAIASEQSARMVAMRNATDNANELMQGPDSRLQQGPPGEHHERAAGHHRRSRGTERMSSNTE